MSYSLGIALLALLQLVAAHPHARQKLTQLEARARHTQKEISVISCNPEYKKSYEDYLDAFTELFHERINKASLVCGSACSTLAFEGVWSGNIRMCLGKGERNDCCVYIICIYHKGTTHDVDGLPCIDELTSPTCPYRTEEEKFDFALPVQNKNATVLIDVSFVPEEKEESEAEECFSISADEYNNCVD